MLLALLIDGIIFFVNKANKYMRICITVEVGLAYLFFILNTEASFLGMTVEELIHGTDMEDLI